MQEISTSDGIAETWKGSSVSMDSNYIVVGSTVDDNGAVYIFEMDGEGEWHEIQKIVAPEIDENFKKFGESVAVSGNVIVVGAPGHIVYNGNFVDRAGSAYIFERDDEGIWQFIQKILASDWSEVDRFGTSVSIAGDRIIISAPYDDIAASEEDVLLDAGAAYIFEREGSGNWSEVQKIIGSDPEEGGVFGWSVSISGDKVIVGAVDQSNEISGGDSLVHSGSAYIFERELDGNWSEVSKLLPSHQNLGASFGWSVSIYDEYAIVGAPWNDTDSLGENVLGAAGASYIFKRLNQGTWGEVQKIVASDRMSPGYFGWSVSIGLNRALVGAVLQATNGKGEAGAAYVYEKDESENWPEVQRILPDVAVNSDWIGYSVAISGNLAYVGKRRDSGYTFERSEVSGSLSPQHRDLIDIYPNPTSGSITVNLGRDYQSVDITLFNTMGQVVDTDKFNNTNLITLELPDVAGVYILQINTKEGPSSTFTLVKH